jgi:hypothetical protein
MGRSYLATQIASAEILAEQAAEMIADAAEILKDASESEWQKEFFLLSDKVGIAVERLRRKRMDIEADGAESEQC